jgi:hypothetical protein
VDQLITTDAGNTSCATAGLTVELGNDYFAQLKSEHGAIHAEAARVFGHCRRDRPHATYADAQHGQVGSCRV